MAVCVRSRRAKRVTDPLDDRVKACICGQDHHHNNKMPISGYASSGSEHEGEVGAGACAGVCAGDDFSCLSDLIHGFLVEPDDNDHDLDHDRVSTAGDACTLSDDEENENKINHNRSSSSSLQISHLLVGLLNPTDSDTFRLILHNRVSAAIESTKYSSASTTTFLNNNNNKKSLVRRRVMSSLREAGYNAGICKTRWETCGGLSSGNYEFIDVVSERGVRYYVDVDFSGEFEIARASGDYERLLKVLPKVFVGRSEELKKIVKVVCEAAKRSLKSRELLLSPWRKNRFMQMKWFGPYKRTVNEVPLTSMAVPFQRNGSGQNQSESKFAVKCQAIGFNVVSNGNGGFVGPVATRTR